MPVINGIQVRYGRGLNVHAWEWETGGGTVHQIAWVAGGGVLLYGVRGPGNDRWTVTSMDPDRWDVPGGTLAAARERVTELLSTGGKTR